ncbi:hypothetical protein FA95DRAFT_1684722 [Auriscalpium vulgare]|uniref:Uncharacterized protein n=1 Tax=Auriscalpium vulgare TaxID=40419 RepID=A0ACB8R237_9AGAM|nr:hypothetical protein FA95DRAFT_1684722 [Auriscalpium vulgare]
MSCAPPLPDLLVVVSPLASWFVTTNYVSVWLALYCTAATSIVIMSITPMEQKFNLSAFANTWLFVTTVGGITAGTVCVCYDGGSSEMALCGMGLLAFMGGVVLFSVSMDSGSDCDWNSAGHNLRNDSHFTAPNPLLYGATGTSIVHADADAAERAEAAKTPGT